MKKAILCSAVLALLAFPAFAQQSLKLEIKDGLVNLDAAAVPARQILAEWARIGTTKVVGSDRITGLPLTLKLVNVPERQALDIILRNVAGYMAAPRLASAAPGASGYDRILILPTSAGATTASANAPRAATTPPFNAPNRGLPRPPDADGEVVMQPPPPELAEQQDPNAPPNQPVFTFPQPQPGQNVFMPPQPGAPQFNPFGAPQPPGAPPQITLQPTPNGQPMIYNFLPNGGAPPPPAGNSGFTVIGSPTPGVVQQPQPQPGQPVPVRPPGGR